MSAGSSRPPDLAARIEARAVPNYISPPFLTQATVHELIHRGAFEPNLERVNGLLRRGGTPCSARSSSDFEGDATWSEPEGGYFVWVDLPGRRERAARRAEAAGVTFVKGADFFPGGDGGERSARLAFSYESPSEIDEGVSHPRLALALTAPVQLREQHAADEAGEQHSRITQISDVLASPKTKSTDASWSLWTTNAIRYATIRSSRPSVIQSRGCQLRSNSSRGDSAMAEPTRRAKVGAAAARGTRRGCSGGASAPAVARRNVGHGVRRGEAHRPALRK